MVLAHRILAEQNITSEQTAMAQFAIQLAEGLTIKSTQAPEVDAMQITTVADPSNNLGAARTATLVTTEYIAADQNTTWLAMANHNAAQAA